MPKDKKLTKAIITYKPRGKIEEFIVKHLKKYRKVEFDIMNFNLVKDKFEKLLDKGLIEIEFV